MHGCTRLIGLTEQLVNVFDQFVDQLSGQDAMTELLNTTGAERRYNHQCLHQHHSTTSDRGQPLFLERRMPFLSERRVAPTYPKNCCTHACSA